ncbi:hypothetical protein EYM_05885 [Ignicoccus islandicus DSM 13165]|uniref:Uncharacterized protein n=1 Tax=Ignicoccus islandicus DSM 13165 TaxID=940295 RepID=A0A0U3F4Y4_9CREN|nr:hypothetical protein EYM_05885 [Ignicoccus islandicus DSM 13165]
MRSKGAKVLTIKRFEVTLEENEVRDEMKRDKA